MDNLSNETQSGHPKLRDIGAFKTLCFKIIIITFVVGALGTLAMLLPFSITPKNDIGVWIIKNMATAGMVTAIPAFIILILAFEAFISIHTYSGWKSGRLYIGKGQSVYRTKNTILFPFFALLYGLLAITMITVTFLIIFNYVFSR